VQYFKETVVTHFYSEGVSTMRLMMTLVSVLILAVLGFSAVMLAAYDGPAPCPTCRDLITPDQGGLIHLQIAGMVVGGAVGAVVAWFFNCSRVTH
jgi:hypothetical protein